MKTYGVGIVLMIALFFSLPYHCYLRWLWKKNPDKAWKKGCKYVSGFFRAELKIAGCKVEVRGKENIPEDTACLFVGNHRSYFDILVYHETIGRPVGFIAKKEMEKIPLLPLYMRDIGCLFLDRNDIRQGLAIINEATEYIKMGHSMILFPEGHRNSGKELLPFKEGGYKIAEKAKCPIVPVAVTGTDLMLEAAPKKRIRKGNVIIEFGKPIYSYEMPVKERKEILSNMPAIIQDMRDTHKLQ